MRMFRLLATMAVSIAGTVTVHAQTPPTNELTGTTAPNVVNTGAAWCNVESAATTFKRSGGGLAKISFDGINYVRVFGQTSAPAYHTLKGQAVLAFSSPTSGVISFPFRASYDSSVRMPQFSNYSQTYDSARGVLTVTYKILFANCPLPVSAVYRN